MTRARLPLRPWQVQGGVQNGPSLELVQILLKKATTRDHQLGFPGEHFLLSPLQCEVCLSLAREASVVMGKGACVLQLVALR